MNTDMKLFSFAKLEQTVIDKSLSRKYNLSLLKKHSAFPVKISSENEVVFAISDPYDVVAKNAISMATDSKVTFVVADKQLIEGLIDSALAEQSKEDSISILDADKGESESLKTGKNEISAYDERNINNDPNVILVNHLIKEAIEQRASDIHIEPFEDTVKVRYRIDGELLEKDELPVSAYAEICARIKVMAEMDIAEKRVPQDGHIVDDEKFTDHDLRVSTLPTVHGEKLVIRVLDKNRLSFTRDEIGFDKESSALVDKILAHPHGIVLLTGPTGCGKSTTLYAFLNEINKSSINIVTVEDPVEYMMDGINQTQVNPKIEFTFASALRSILRQDPDVIMIGEIRDEETAQIATRAAITGHRVFSTLHTNDAPGAITRLVDMGVGSYLVADALVAVISQRLVKRLCPYCKIKVSASEREKRLLGLDTNKLYELYKAKGCANCSGSGYRGRIAVHEIMYVSEEIKNAVFENKTSAKEIRKIALESGMRTLLESCRLNVLQGITDVCEYVKLSTDNESNK